MSVGVGVQLQRARKRAGLSQRGLAARAGVPQSTVARIELDALDPRSGTGVRLLRARHEDVVGTPAGTGGYDHLRRAARLMEIGGVTVWVVSLDDLMEMKRAAGRAKDRYALEVLGALRDELEGRTERE